MDKQEILNKAVAGLASQRFERSETEEQVIGISCRYRGDSGRKCAVGWLIPDEAYMPRMEKLMAETIAFTVLGIQESTTIDFLGELQEAHDCSMSPSEMMGNLTDLAKNHGLVVPKELFPKSLQNDYRPEHV